MTRKLFFALGLVLAAGCQSQLMLAPTPEVLRDERFNLFEANPDPLTSNEISTIYATTRTPREGSRNFFSGRPDSELHLGVADLRIGEEDLSLLELIREATTGERDREFAWNLLDAPVLSSTERPSNPGEGVPILPEDMAESIAALNNYIDRNPIKELTIYVHGANNTFPWSVAQGAQFQFFTGDNAIVLTFAWPSPGSIFRYFADRRRSDKAATDLAFLLELLSQHSTATRINLLAYSAGGRVVGGALTQLAERYDRDALRIGHVYLTQSDQALYDFVTTLPKFFPLVEGLTVTAAQGDPVLTLARMTDFRLRLGAAGRGSGANLNISDELRAEVTEIVNSERMVFLDIREVPEAQFQFTHGAWYDSAWVSTDVMVTLLGGFTAEERGLEATDDSGLQVWTFPEDYVERITRSILARDEADRRVQVPAQGSD
ncbi:MAG: alpha/beta hydrolase [Pseudomonadota bacterium]